MYFASAVGFVCGWVARHLFFLCIGTNDMVTVLDFLLDGRIFGLRTSIYFMSYVT